MTITKEISMDEIRSLDLHQGDSLSVVSELGSRLIVRIVKAASPVPKLSSGKASAWAHKYLGAASTTGTTDEIRMAHFQEKYGA